MSKIHVIHHKHAICISVTCVVNNRRLCSNRAVKARHACDCRAPVCCPPSILLERVHTDISSEMQIICPMKHAFLTDGSVLRGR